MENDTPSPDESGVTHQRTLPERTHQPEEEEPEGPIPFEDPVDPEFWQEYEAERIRQEEFEEELRKIGRRQKEEEERISEIETRRWRNLRFQEEQERLAEERQQRQRRLETEAKEQVAARIRLQINTIVSWSLLIPLAIAVAGFGFSVGFNGSDLALDNAAVDSLRKYSLLAILLISPLLALFLSFRGSDISDNQINKLRQEREEITQRIARETKKDIFYTIQLNLNQLTEYYTINKKQAKNSFNFSIGASSAGLITIFAGIWFYYVKTNNIPATYITSIAGAILEFIGGAYFFIYKKSLEQVNLFFNQLVVNQDTMLAIELTKLNRNSRKRSVIQEKIITSLLERSRK